MLSPTRPGYSDSRSCIDLVCTVKIRTSDNQHVHFQNMVKQIVTIVVNFEKIVNLDKKVCVCIKAVKNVKPVLRAIQCLLQSHLWNLSKHGTQCAVVEKCWKTDVYGVSQREHV